MAGRRTVGSRESIVDSRGSVVGSRKSVGGQGEARKKSPLELDRLIHERLRLGIISALAVNERLTFNDLKRLLQTTDGNLSVHARKLEEAQYVSCEKSFEGRMPRTEYRLTAAGRRALEKYLTHMESIIKAVRD
jgi:DNA-binding HxlR family transcriptional regulator